MRFWRRASRTVALSGGCAFVTLMCLQADPARAFDLSSLDVFGLFTKKDEPPAPSPSTLPYKLDFELGDADDAKALTRSLQDASLLYRLRQDAPPDGETLARRMATDLNPLVDALWSQGYFNADVALVVDGVALRVGAEPGAAWSGSWKRTAIATPCRSSSRCVRARSSASATLRWSSTRSPAPRS